MGSLDEVYFPKLKCHPSWIECCRVSFDAVRPTTERQAIAWALVFSSIPDLFLRQILLDHPLRLANGDPLSENTDLLTRNCNILIDAATVADVGGIWLLFCFIPLPSYTTHHDCILEE